eukprot:jgi/Psemu1/322946/estExt_fgenesh1_pg.C_490011
MTKLLRICCLFATYQITTVQKPTVEAFQSNACVAPTMIHKSSLGNIVNDLRYTCTPQDERIATKRRSFSQLFVQSDVSSSSLLEGKLSILQDVVKEMDARHKHIQGELETAEQEYLNKLEALESELEEARKVTGVRDEAIQNLNDELKKMEEQFKSDIEQLTTVNDQEREKQAEEFSAQSTDVLEKARAEFTTRIDELKSQLESKEKEIKEMADKFAAKEEDNNKIIDGLRNDIVKKKESQKDPEAETAAQGDDQKIMQTEESELAALEKIESLKAEHKQMIESVRNEESERAAQEIETLKAEHEQMVEAVRAEESQRAQRGIEILKAEHQWVAKDIRTEESKQAAEEIEKLKAEHQQIVEDIKKEEARQLTTEIERLTADHEKAVEDVREEEARRLTIEIEILTADHEKVVEDYKIQLEKIMHERDELSAKLKEISTGSEEQIEIATAAVQAGKKREDRIRIESERLAQQLKKSRLHVKIMRWAMNGVADENRHCLDHNRELSSEREELEDKLGAALSRIAELEEEKQRSLWQKLKGRFSRKGAA